MREKELLQLAKENGWNWISSHETLSEKFISRHKDDVNWDCISEYQKLSEEFIKKHKDDVDWAYISISQKLSEEFISKHKDNDYERYIMPNVSTISSGKKWGLFKDGLERMGYKVETNERMQVTKANLVW